MKTKSKLSLTLGLILSSLAVTGCASNCGSCSSGNGLFGTRILENQPIRSTFRSWFQGDTCDTCNAPAGQVSYSPNTASLCETCNGGMGSSSMMGTSQPLYGAPLEGAQFGTPELVPAQPGPISGDTSGSFGGGISNGANPPQF